MRNKLILEGFGTFILVLAIQMAAFELVPNISTPFFAALTLGILVYTIGIKTGCHVNPAVTLGLWSIKKMPGLEATYYIIAQLVGAGVASMSLALLEGASLNFGLEVDSWRVMLGEFIGAIVFGFGVAAVVYNKIHSDIHGIVIGGSLFIGILLAFGIGSAGILNPAVALSMGAVGYSLFIGPVIGVVVGMNLYRKLVV